MGLSDIKLKKRSFVVIVKNVDVSIRTAIGVRGYEASSATLLSSEKRFQKNVERSNATNSTARECTKTNGERSTKRTLYTTRTDDGIVNFASTSTTTIDRHDVTTRRAPLFFMREAVYCVFVSGGFSDRRDGT